MNVHDLPIYIPRKAVIYRSTHCCCAVSIWVGIPCTSWRSTVSPLILNTSTIFHPPKKKKKTHKNIKYWIRDYMRYCSPKRTNPMHSTPQADRLGRDDQQPSHSTAAHRPWSQTLTQKINVRFPGWWRTNVFIHKFWTNKEKNIFSAIARHESNLSNRVCVCFLHPYAPSTSRLIRTFHLALDTVLNGVAVGM